MNIFRIQMLPKLWLLYLMIINKTLIQSMFGNIFLEEATKIRTILFL